MKRRPQVDIFSLKKYGLDKSHSTASKLDNFYLSREFLSMLAQGVAVAERL